MMDRCHHYLQNQEFVHIQNNLEHMILPAQTKAVDQLIINRDTQFLVYFAMPQANHDAPLQNSSENQDHRL